MVKKSRNVVSSNSETKVKVGLSLTPSSADRLNLIARKLGISRSELLERLAQGALDISSDKSKVSVTWEKGEETEVEPAQLEGETVEEIEINDAVTAEIPSSKVSVQPNPLQASYESLQNQLTERESSIAQLQQQLATEQQNLASQLAETVTKSSYESLQQQFASEQQNLASQLAETVSKSSYQKLQHQLAEKESAIGDLQVQLTKLQYLENQLSQSVAKQRNYDALQQQSQEQLRTIKALREQLGQMQAVAGIGEAYLNKWRRP